MSATVTVTVNASGYYDEVEIEDMDYDPKLRAYLYPCPCGDKFRITLVCCNALLVFLPLFFLIFLRYKKDDIRDGEEIARCPSCSLIIRVIYSPDDFEFPDDEEEEEEDEDKD